MVTKLLLSFPVDGLTSATASACEIAIEIVGDKIIIETRAYP